MCDMRVEKGKGDWQRMLCGHTLCCVQQAVVTALHLHHVFCDEDTVHLQQQSAWIRQSAKGSQCSIFPLLYVIVGADLVNLLCLCLQEADVWSQLQALCNQVPVNAGWKRRLQLQQEENEQLKQQNKQLQQRIAELEQRLPALAAGGAGPTQ